VIIRSHNKLSKFTPLQTAQLRGTALSGRPLARRYSDKAEQRKSHSVLICALGLLSSFIFSLPLSYFFYFVIDHIQNVSNKTIFYFIPIGILLVFSTHSLRRPGVYIQIMKNFIHTYRELNPFFR